MDAEEMSTEEFMEYMGRGETVTGGSPAHEVMHRLSREAIGITFRLNNEYHTPEEIVSLMSELTGTKVDDSFRLFPPFHTDCGKNLRIGKRVFINSGCKFQDQGGIDIGDDVLIGHNCVITTLDHAMDPERRADMIPAPVKIGDKVWIGANVTILPGVTVGDGAILAAGVVVTRDVEPRTIVGGVPARLIRHIR